MADGGAWLGEMWQSMSWPMTACTIVLVVMFCRTIVEAVQHGVLFARAIYQSKSFIQKSRSLREIHDWERLLALVTVMKKSHVATVFSAALREFLITREHLTGEQAIASAEREARVTRNRIHEDLRKGLSGLASIATTAPLVGLMGTVIGILDSFSGSAMQKAAYLALVADHIARALVMTALGMLVAMVAVWTFNCLTDWLGNLDAEMQITRLEFVSHLEQLRRSGKL